MGAAVVMTGEACAQETRADRTAAAAEVPWYERFTFVPGDEQAPAWSAANPRIPNALQQESGRWGLTVNMGESDRLAAIEPIAPRDQAAIGAFFRFTPNVRVGGKLSVQDPSTLAPPGASTSDSRSQPPGAGVKLESAIRF